MGDDGKVVQFRAPSEVEITIVLGEQYQEIPPSLAVVVAAIIERVEKGELGMDGAILSAAAAGYAEGWEDAADAVYNLDEEADGQVPSD